MADRSEADIMRQVAWRLLPFLGIGYYVNALDRSNIAVAAEQSAQARMIVESHRRAPYRFSRTLDGTWNRM